jgi:hypothetical protein
MKQFEIKVKTLASRKRLNIYLLLQYKNSVPVFPRAPAERKRPYGVGGWHLQVKHSP